MRRHDRETSYRDAVAILQGCRYVTIAFHGGEYPYAVPMHFGLTEESGALTLWFHGADEGKSSIFCAAMGASPFLRSVFVRTCRLRGRQPAPPRRVLRASSAKGSF